MGTEQDVLQAADDDEDDQDLQAHKYLTFALVDEQYGIKIAHVVEIIGMQRVTPVPEVPAYIRGVINLRGKVIPVVDLRLKFGMSKTEKSVNTCIIITEVTVDNETTILGALADSVQEVMDLEADHISPAPKIGTRLNTEFIKGMGRHNDRFIIILDIDKVFSTSELAMVQDTQAASTEATSGNQ